MRFISRRVGLAQVAVIDTDTGEETIMYLNAVRDTDPLGDIHGHTLRCVDDDWEPGKDQASGRMSIERYEPWQNQDDRVRLQAKTAVLKNVEVRTYKSMVTAIVWGIGDVHEDYTIRLSDFGSFLGDSLFIEGDGDLNGHILTVIVDDKVMPVNNFTFRAARQFEDEQFRMVHGVVLDLRELTMDGFAEQIYWACAHEFDMGLSEMFVDNPERKQSMLDEIIKARFNDPRFGDGGYELE